MMRTVVVLAAAVALAGCGTDAVRRIQSFFELYKGEPALASGLRQYEEGQYEQSLRSLTSAVDRGLADDDLVVAHKHAAFIHCAAGRERACREEFRKALAIDPGMDLAPAEAGHPIWGPVFRSVKARR